MKTTFTRMVALLLCAVMTIGLLPAHVFAADSSEVSSYQPTDQAITIRAEAENTITVNETEPPTEPEETEPEDPVEDIDGKLDIQAGTYSIARDYEQTCMITVTNNFDHTVEFYLDAENTYSDISLQIIKSGSVDSPIVILAGESLEVELTVFAQNAEHETFVIPVTAHVLEESGYAADATATITLNCDLPTLDLAWTMLSEDETTLRQKWQIRNNGDTLTDLVLSASGDAAGYLNFNPIVSNFELAAGATFEFTVQPDLAKMKNNGVTVLAGYLVASCAGISSTAACTFDTKGQEITVTTMGALALQQDGNPFTKFELIEDSISFRYYNGEEYVSADQLALEELLDDDHQFDLEFHANVDLGVEVPMGMDIVIQSQKITDDSFSVEEPYAVTFGEDGTIQANVSILVSAEEYESIINGNAALSVMQFALHAGNDQTADTAADDPVEAGERFLLDVTFKINDLLDKIGDWIDKVPSSEGLSALGFAYDVCKALEGIMLVSENPNMSDEDKALFYIVSIADIVINIGTEVFEKAGPVAWLVFNGLKLIYDYVSDKLKDMLTEDVYNKYAELLEEVDGFQCTNRGSLGAEFYSPNYKTDTATDNYDDPILYVNSRMYADGYVDREETNYDIYLNDEPAGSTNTTGVTEMAMAQISTENLKPGEVNRIEWDYDTFPGHYWVSTETDIHLLYPNETEIGYIGTPDDLDDVRTHPDAVIYPENIFSETGLIIGEATVLAFNIYNTGSKGGWFTITVTDGENVIYSNENHYMAPFSTERLSALWTPAAQSSQITVTLENTSVDLEERDSSNNSATKILTARTRVTPVVDSIYTDTVYEGNTYTVSASISNRDDVTDVKFYIDDALVIGTVKSSGSRYWQSCPGNLAAGEHTARVEVTYTTGFESLTVAEQTTFTVLENVIVFPSAYSSSADTLMYGDTFEFYVTDIENHLRTEVSVDGVTFIALDPDSSAANTLYYSLSTEGWVAGEKTIYINMYYQGKTSEELVATEFTVTTVSEADSYFRFSVDDTLTAYNTYLYNSSGSLQNFELEELEDGTSRVKKTLDMYQNPDVYTFAVISDDAVILKSLTETDPVFSLNDCNQVHFNGTESIYITYMDIEKIGTMNIPDKVMNNYDTLYLSPNTYTLYMNIRLGSNTVTTRVTADVTAGDQTFYLEDLFVIYRFQIEDAAHSSYKAKLYYRNSGSTYWSSSSMSKSFNTETGILQCYSTSTYTKQYVEAAEEVRVIVYSDDEVYVTQVKAPEEAQTLMLMTAEPKQDSTIYTLNRNSLIPVQMVCEESGLTISSIEVSNSYYYVYLYGSTLYLPADEYTFTTTINTGTQTLVNEVTASVEDSCDVVVDSGLSDVLTDLTVSWDARYNEFADLESNTEEGTWIYANDVSSGYTFKVETGYRTIEANLYQGNNRFTFRRYYSDLTDEGTQMNISGDLTAVIDESFGSYDGGSRVYYYLDSICDANENTLYSWYVYSNSPMYGNVYFTDVEDADHVVTVPFTTTSRGNYVTIPTEPGTYTMTVELYSYAVAVDSTHTHTEVTDPAVDATCTTDGLTEGSHCSVCGEILVAQTVIPAAGHSLSYADLGDGTHSVTCTNCDYSAVESHTYSNGVCTACAAVEHIHSYDAPTFTWTEDYSACTAVFTCTGCGDEQLLTCAVTAETTAATCTEDGLIRHSASVEFGDQSYSDIQDQTIPAAGHSYIDGVCEHCGEAENAPSVPVTPVKPWWMILLERLIGWLHDWCIHGYMEYLCPFC